MTETFTASNGWHVDEDGYLAGPSKAPYLNGGSIRAAERFFQEKRDAELGRWRDTVEPHIVCYSRGRDYVRVTSERSGEYWEFKRGEVVAASTAECVAERYFQAHPVRKPLPTEPGLYVHATSAREHPLLTRVLVRGDGGWYFYGDPGTDAERSAQLLHDLGELVRLAPVESEATND